MVSRLVGSAHIMRKFAADLIALWALLLLITAAHNDLAAEKVPTNSESSKKDIKKGKKALLETCMMPLCASGSCRMRTGPPAWVELFSGSAARPSRLLVQRRAASLKLQSTGAHCVQAKVALCGGSNRFACRKVTLQNTGSRHQAENAPRLQEFDSNCSNCAANADV